MALNNPKFKFQTIPREAWNPNDWADFWRYDVGVNVIPANTKMKKPYYADKSGQQNWISWSDWQDKPIPQDQHEEWKKQDAFKDGLAIICGTCWHTDPSKYLNAIDCDNKLGLDSWCPNGLDDVAKITLTEQHDNKNKVHILYDTNKPLPNKTLMSGENGPKIEVKSNNKCLLYCAGGVHKDGSLIKIVGTDKPKLVDFESLKIRLEDIFSSNGDSYDVQELKTGQYSEPLYNVTEKIHEGENRSVRILSYLDHLKIKNPEFDENMLFHLARDYESKHCVGQYPDEKIRGLVNQAMVFVASQKQKNSTSEPDETERLERESKETPLEQIERYLNTQVKNDPHLISQLLRTCLSTYTNDPINIALLSPSSEGKTYATVKVTDIFPEEDVISVGRMSPTALIHQHGVLIDNDGNPIRERLEELEKQITETEDKQLKKEFQHNRAILLEGARNCIDLKNKILLFLDNPAPATYEMLKPIMSHDKKEIIYKTTKGDGSLNVKETVIRNWPVFIFCSAKNEDKNEVWEEIKTRVLMTSPESTVKKYKEANRFTALKMGLPSWGSGVYHSDEDERWAKWYIQEFKKNLNQLCKDGNPTMNPFWMILSNVFPSSQGDFMRHFSRLCSFVNLETMLNVDRRPIYEVNSDTFHNKTIISTIDDIEKACKILGEISSLPPEKIKFYRDVFCPLFEQKQYTDSTLDGPWLSSADLAIEYTKKLGKTTDFKKISENYLKPLTDAGVLEALENPNNRKQNLYKKSGNLSIHNISELKSKVIDGSKVVLLGVISCLESLSQLSMKKEKTNENFTFNDQNINLEQLLDVISGIPSKVVEA